jgi:hypothetical protein
VAVFKPALLRDASPVESSNLAVNVVVLRALEIRVVRIHLALGRLAPRVAGKDGQSDHQKKNRASGTSNLMKLPTCQHVWRGLRSFLVPIRQIARSRPTCSFTTQNRYIGDVYKSPALMGSELMSLAGRVTQGVIDNSRRRREWMRMRLLPVDDTRDFHPTGFQKIRISR